MMDLTNVANKWPMLRVTFGVILTFCCAGGPIGQRDDRTDAGDRHRAPAHVVVADDGQQAAMQDAELLAKHLSDNEQRFDQDCQLGKVLDQFRDAGLELHLTGHSDLKTEVA